MDKIVKEQVYLSSLEIMKIKFHVVLYQWMLGLFYLEAFCNMIMNPLMMAKPIR